jgi:putative tryptophan/tyrosine transport system substrate-binding protein
LTSQRHNHLITRRQLSLCALANFPLATALRAQPAVGGAVAVLIPDVDEPFRSVFSQIIDGVEDRLPGRVVRMVLSARLTTVELADDLLQRGARLVIALGRQGLNVATRLDERLPVILGGVLGVPETLSRVFAIHSLAPYPGMIFNSWRQLVPTAQRVHVVFDPRQNAWLIKLARESARQLGLELNALEAADLTASLRQHEQTLAGMDPKRDALWLAQDTTTVEDSAVLPLVLSEAWKRQLVLLSSSLAHVKRGVLMAPFPDNRRMGRALGESALRQMAGGKAADGVQALRELRSAVNSRTASHLGLDIALGRFDLVLPES